MNTENNSLKNKIVVVIGGTTGIGKSIMSKCADKGAQLAFCSSKESNVNVMANHLKKSGCEHFYAAVSDVRFPDQIKCFMDDVIDKYGVIDVLVNSAGIGTFKPIEEFSDEEWQRIIDINLSGSFNVCREAVKIMRNQSSNPRGYIINIGSISHRLYIQGNSAYASSKAAQQVLTNYLFEEVRQDNIFVTYLAIGSVNTPFSKRHPKGHWKIQPEDIADIVHQYIQHYLTNPSCCISYSEIRVRHPKKITRIPVYKE